jgi:hypothetical protein
VVAVCLDDPDHDDADRHPDQEVDAPVERMGADDAERPEDQGADEQ